MCNLERSVLLERPNDYDQTEYMHVSVPWPPSDRSAIVRAQITVSDDLDRVTIAGHSVNMSAPDSLPMFVRAIVHESTFQMTQVGDCVEGRSYRSTRNLMGIVCRPQSTLPR